MHNREHISDQENFWAGEFGTQYISRNRDSKLLASNLNFFSRALRHAGNIHSCIELGANIGMNLQALQLLYPDIQVTGVEINRTAAEELATRIGKSNVFCGSIHDYQQTKTADLALVKGVLIHLNPSLLPKTYELLHNISSRFILICEYYNPTPVAISYRGHSDKLFKRDFAGEMLEKFPALKLVDYGFSYKRDQAFPQDDITWFLLEKK